MVVSRNYRDMSADLSIGITMIRSQPNLVRAVLLTLAMAPAAGWGNPDVWVRVVSTWHFGAAGVTGVTFEWRFDDFFSARTASTYDANRNATLEPSESTHLREEIFDPLSRFDYYVHVWSGDQLRTGLVVEDFTAFVEAPNLVYRFTIALEPPADPVQAPLVVSLHDPRTVVDFQFVKERFLLVDGTMNSACKFSIRRGRGALSGHTQPVTLDCGG